MQYVCYGCVTLLQADPYLKGIVVPEQDTVPESLSRLSLKITEVKEALHSLNSLEIKLKVSLSFSHFCV